MLAFARCFARALLGFFFEEKSHPLTLPPWDLITISGPHKELFEPATRPAAVGFPATAPTMHVYMSYPDLKQQFVDHTKSFSMWGPNPLHDPWQPNHQ
ncbi:hypothetical protein SFRURICE_021275, partial [Spodoptera frugiperda]